MHRRKKLALTATAVALLMAAGSSSAMAGRGEGPDENDPPRKVTICHATGSETHPFERIHVSENAAEAHAHHQHEEDMFFYDDDNDQQCPGPTQPPGGGNGGDHDDENCSAESSSGDSTANQSGLINVGNVNVGLANLGSNILCQPDIASYLTAAVFGVANGSGSDSGSDGDNCTAESESGDSDADQDGLVNVGNVNVDASNALSNVLCQAEVLDYHTLSVLGHSTGGPSLGTGLLGGGVLTNLLDADASLLAKLVVIL